jgi:hypothetical protein
VGVTVPIVASLRGFFDRLRRGPASPELTLFHQLGLKHFHVDYRFFVSKPEEFVPDSE